MTVYSGELTCSLNTNRFRVAIDEDRSTTGVSKITLTFQYRRTNSYTSYSTNVTSTSTIGNVSNRAVSVSNTTWKNFGSVTRNYTHTDAQTITINYKSDDAYGRFTTETGSMQYTMAAFGSAPTAPTISALAASASQINTTWGTTDLGTPTGTVYLYGDTSTSPSTQRASKTTTGDTTYNHTGLTANTRYYYKSTATNTIGSASSSTVSAVTYPAGITSISVSSTTSNSATVSITFASSGSALTTTAQVSSDNSTWSNTNLTNVQGTTKTYTFTGLSPLSSYTRYFRVHTSAGDSASVSITFTTQSDVKFYGSASDRAKKIIRMRGSADNKAKKITKIYGSVDGRAKLLFRG